jgi:DNA-binding MarR family transcriptional regulator
MEENITDREDMLNTLQKLQHIRFNELIRDLNQSEYIFLKILHKLIKKSGTNSVYVATIAKELEISTPAVSKMLKNLEKKQYVTREVDPLDRRNTHVFLTQKGTAAKKEADKFFEKFFNKIYQKINKEDIIQFLHLAKKISNVLIDEINMANGNNSEKEKQNS